MPETSLETGAKAPTLTMYTTTWCGDCQVTKRALSQLEIPYTEVNIEENPAAAELVMMLNGGRRSVPTLVYNGEAESMSRFSRAKLDNFLLRHQLLSE